MNNGIASKATTQGDLGVRGFGNGIDRVGSRRYPPGGPTWNAEAWRAAYTRARNGLGQAHIAVFGDSLTEGYTIAWSDRWTEVMQSRIAAVTGVPVGTGITSMTPWSIGTYSTDTRFAGTASVWREGNNLGGFQNIATWDYFNAPGSYTVEFTPTQPVDSLVVWTAESTHAVSGTTDVLVDSSPVESGIASGGAVALKRREYTVAPGVHTLGWRSNNVVDGVRQYVIGFEGVRNASRGVKVTTHGMYGYLMSGHDDNVGDASSKAANNWALFQLARIDLFIWAFGLNEWNTQQDPATLAGKFDEFARYQRTTSYPCSVILMVEPPPAPNPPRDWDAYVSVIRNAAARYRWGLIDVTAAWGTRANKLANYSDTLHPTVAGYAEIGQTAANVVLSAVA